jgi:hypothetical protein
VPPAPPADAVPPAPPADVPPPPGDLNVASPTQQASNVGYTRQLWEAIRGADIHGNDALDSLAQPAPAS